MHRSINTAVLGFAFLAGIPYTNGAAPTGVPAAGDVAFFEREVRPVLSENCYECHSSRAKKLKAGLYLDSREGVLQGGDTGPAIVPGNADESLLITGVRYHDVDFQMPPKSRLPEKAVAALEKWVAIGAPWPKDAGERSVQKAKGFDIEARRSEHWCWEPPRKIAPPEVMDVAWPAGPVDHFVLAKLESVGLKPAPDADKRALIRRVTFDLTGLPPTPDEVASFVADRSPAAYEQLVDRLLGSPHFGEKWARHWLDLVRYGESYGHEFDYPIPHAWRYRDYVIRAFNTDVPYNFFVAEHIAGDLLPNPRQNPGEAFNESVLGTGYWYLGESVHAPTDVRGDEADRIDNQIDVFSRSFLGLTIACARCHDHKFDAVSTKDYYAIAGFLQSTRRQLTMLDPGARIETAAAKLRLLQRSASRKLPRTKGTAAARPNSGDVIATFDGGMPGGWSTTGEAFADAPTPLDRPSACLGTPAKPIAPGGVMHSGLFSRKLHGVLRSPTFTLTEPNLHLLMASEGPVTVRVVVDGHYMHAFSDLLLKGTILKGGAAETKGEWQWKHLGRDLVKYVGHNVYLEFVDEGDGYIAVDEIRYAGPPRGHAQVTFEIAGAAELIKPGVKGASEIERDLPAPVYALGVVDGTPENERVHIRGSHTNLGSPVPRRMPTALGGDERPASDTASGRLELAEQIVDPNNPLTARVYVNRLWHHLTGRGIVSTVDDFGVMGLPPTHPELLDWLARDFVECGWSTKRAIRQIALSRTYRMATTASEANPAAKIAQADPENILLHKARVRRLTAEAIRDGILAVSGRLDRKLFGPSVAVHLTSFMEGRGRPQSGPVDGQGRRSIYIGIRRNFLPAFLLAFDMPSPFSTMGRRSVSNVPAQALVLMNDPFVIQQAEHWAKNLLESSLADDQARIVSAYLSAFSRNPSRGELQKAKRFLTNQAELHDTNSEDLKVWTDFCHVLFNKKEFIFLR